MKYLTLFTISSLFYIGANAQIESAAAPQINPGFKNIKLFPSGSIQTFQTGTQPFSPELTRHKVVFGYPLNGVGVGLSQQYKANPNQTELWNPRPMLPIRGLPQHPQYGLKSTSPVLSFISPNARVHSFSAGRLNQGGFVPAYREYKVVQGFKLD